MSLLTDLLTGGASALWRLGRGGGSDGNSGAEVPSGIPSELWDQLQDLFEMGRQEYTRADPLRLAVLQLAYRMMPGFAREGVPGLSLDPLTGGTRTRTGTRTGRGPMTNEEITEAARAAANPTPRERFDRQQRRAEARRELRQRTPRGPVFPRYR